MRSFYVLNRTMFIFVLPIGPSCVTCDCSNGLSICTSTTFCNTRQATGNTASICLSFPNGFWKTCGLWRKCVWISCHLRSWSSVLQSFLMDCMFGVQVWTSRPALRTKIPWFILQFLQENSGVVLEFRPLYLPFWSVQLFTKPSITPCCNLYPPLLTASLHIKYLTKYIARNKRSHCSFAIFHLVASIIPACELCEILRWM